tara:strand:+ start:651 stop:1091 length:441 start_codon:yes stop_codon:yes gene_type:complete
MGEWNEYNMLRFPLTTKIIKGLRIPLAVRGVMFARQQPGSGVQPHSDGRNFILTCHLGVKVPEPNDGTTDGARKCWLKVAGERHEWQTDKAVVFDTSFQVSTLCACYICIVFLCGAWHENYMICEITIDTHDITHRDAEAIHHPLY